MGAVTVTEKDFESQVLKSDLPVLVDFWAEWCGPCRALSPVIDEIADDFQGKLKVAKVDIEQAQELAAKYNVTSIPNLIVFKEGQVAEQIVGALPKDHIVNKLNPLLS